MTTARGYAMHDVLNGARIWWEERGSGPPVVLIPGGPGNASDYLDPLATMLAGEWRAVQYDPRGCGRSERRPPYALSTLLSDLDALRTCVDVPRWAVVGHSAGASSAVAYALEFPDRVAGVVAIAGGSGIHDDRQWHAAYEAGRDAGLDPQPDTRFPPNMELNRRANESWKQYIKQPSLLRRISRLAVPLLAIHGDRDIRPGWPMEQLAALVPLGRFRVIEGASHIPWTTHPEPVHARVTEFLRELHHE